MAKKITPSRNREQTLNVIFEECVDLASEIGLENLQAEQIAKRCRVSRTLLNHYFPKDLKRSLRRFLIERVLEDFRAYIDDALKGQTHPEKILKIYVRSHFAWGREYPSKLSILLSFFPQCVVDPELREANTLSVQSGLKRIETLLYYSVKQKEQVPKLARKVQIFLTGAIISHFTENAPAGRSVGAEKLVLSYISSITEA
jgi:AcrR family transcriptional regulator